MIFLDIRLLQLYTRHTMTTIQMTTMTTQNEDCDKCKVSMMNEGGCDCQIIKCAECDEEDHKYNHHLCEGKLLCDDCYDTWACQQDGYENECDDFNLRNDDKYICECCGQTLNIRETAKCLKREICAECCVTDENDDGCDCPLCVACRDEKEDDFMSYDCVVCRRRLHPYEDAKCEERDLCWKCCVGANRRGCPCYVCVANNEE